MSYLNVVMVSPDTGPEIDIPDNIAGEPVIIQASGVSTQSTIRNLLGGLLKAEVAEIVVVADSRRTAQVFQDCARIQSVDHITRIGYP